MSVAPPGRAQLELVVDGVAVIVPDRGVSLLDLLREDLGCRSAKDGCSPQGQCGCCTVLVDGSPRVACVTPARRVANRAVTTLDGLSAEIRDRWSDALLASGGSQCGFCTPGIIVRLEGLRAKDPSAGVAAAEQALLAHLCRCTGWRTIVDAFEQVTTGARSSSAPGRDLGGAARRAALEGGEPQLVDAAVVLGGGGFAADTAPDDALVAVPDGSGGWSVAETLSDARSLADRVQGRRTTVAASPPLELPAGPWDLTLRTSWVEPAYLEPDASWCEPGGEPASPLANGGAFGGKVGSVAPAAARQLADRHGRAVLVVLSREDTVRLGPKRPPIAAGIRADGTGVMRVAETPGVAEAIRRAAPGLEVVEVVVPGPATSVHPRAAGWAEATILLAAATGRAGPVRAPDGGQAEATMDPDGTVRVHVAAGDPLDETVLRSYATGAAHMALSWVTSEALAVDPDGQIHDLTIRSFGVLRAVDTPAIQIDIDRSATERARPAVRVGDAVFAAVALAVWRRQDLAPEWPTGIMVRR